MSVFLKGDHNNNSKKDGDNSKKKKKKNDNNPLKNNPFAKVGKALAGAAAGGATNKNRKFGGEGQSLGGSNPGKLIHIQINEPGPIGVKIEKRPNKGGAIVALVVEGSQAARAGIQRGDILCYANTNGQEEILYQEFLQLASSKERPLYFDVRRIVQASSSGGTATSATQKSTSTSTSADAYARKQAMIAAAEARERAHKQRMKPIAKGKETLTQQQQRQQQERQASLAQQQQQQQGSHEPMSEESKRAAEMAKRTEAVHAQQLGYNPYETARATAGQARNATVAMTHGTMNDKKDENAAAAGGSTGNNTAAAAAPGRALPPPVLPEAVSDEFETAYTMLVTTNENDDIKSSIGIMSKLIVNATTKGQADTEDAAKFRKVRLSNAKIKANITDVHGALDIMLAVGFQLHEEDGESFLVYPLGEPGPDWLPESLDVLQAFAKS